MVMSQRHKMSREPESGDNVFPHLSIWDNWAKSPEQGPNAQSAVASLTRMH